MVSGIIERRANDIVRFRLLRTLASRMLLRRGWKSFVRNPPLNVAGLTGEESHRHWHRPLTRLWCFQADPRGIR